MTALAAGPRAASISPSGITIGKPGKSDGNSNVQQNDNPSGGSPGMLNAKSGRNSERSGVGMVGMDRQGIYGVVIHTEVDWLVGPVVTGTGRT